MTIYVPFLVPLAILIKTTVYLLLNQALPFPLLLMSFSLMFGPHQFHLLIVFTTMLFLLTITQYIWLYPSRQKFDVHSTFFAFKQLVENYFTTAIKKLYIDNEGEFLAC